MAERIYKRVPVNIEVRIVSCNVSYTAFVRNISENGIHAKMASIEPGEFILSESDIYLILPLPAGDTVNLNCKKKWSYKNTSNSYIENIGAEIIDPPREYEKYYRTISAGV
jgi:hypothetical protein